MCGEGTDLMRFSWNNQMRIVFYLVTVSSAVFTVFVNFFFIKCDTKNNGGPIPLFKMIIFSQINFYEKPIYYVRVKYFKMYLLFK